jgi:hypothetical protein
MQQITTESGTTYVLDTVNMRVIRKSNVPLFSLFWEDTLSNEWQDISGWAFVDRPGYVEECLRIDYPGGMWSLSTGIVSNVEV